MGAARKKKTIRGRLEISFESTEFQRENLHK